jgi:hypothetical protein
MACPENKDTTDAAVQGPFPVGFGLPSASPIGFSALGMPGNGPMDRFQPQIRARVPLTLPLPRKGRQRAANAPESLCVKGHGGQSAWLWPAQAKAVGIAS